MVIQGVGSIGYVVQQVLVGTNGTSWCISVGDGGIVLAIDRDIFKIWFGVIVVLGTLQQEVHI